MTNIELEQTVSRHDSEIAAIRASLTQTSQLLQETREQMQTGFAHTEAIQQENALQIAANSQQIAANSQQIAANVEQVAANTAGLVELRGILADYLRARSNESV